MNIEYENPEVLKNEIEGLICVNDTVLDIGVGLVPMKFFRPKLHLMIEPHHEYVQVLQSRHANDKSVLIFHGKANDIAPCFATNSVDSVFLLDVIEHLEKEAGLSLLQEVQRIARNQVVVFTPLEFMPQASNGEVLDGWGMQGLDYQVHRSGWTPEDFGPNWDCHICENFHRQDGQGRPLEHPHGAFYAIRTFHDKPMPHPESLPDIRGQLPAERELVNAERLVASLQGELVDVRHELEATRARLAELENIPLLRVARRVRNGLRRLRSNQ